MKKLVDRCARFGAGVAILVVPFAAVIAGLAMSTPSASATNFGPRMACPYSGDYVVQFDARLISGILESDSTSTSIPAGTYKVMLASQDSYEGRQSTYVPGEQDREQYYIELRDGSGTIARTSASQDVPDYVDDGRWQGAVDNTLTVSRTATTAVAMHDYPGHRNQSLLPICAKFEPVASCGNGIKEGGEQCDDGNANNADGCSAQCTDESPAISIDKDDNDNHDDTQQVNVGGDAVYRVVVTNTGKVSLTNVVVTDHMSPNCNRSADQTKAMYDGNTFDPGESFTYTCTDANVTDSHGSTASVTGTPVNGGSNVNDSDSTNVTVKDAPAIWIDKDDNDNHDDTQQVAEGGTATYKVTVKNNGVSPLTDVVITDSHSSDCNRSAAETKSLYEGDTFDPGETFEYTCTESNVSSSHSSTASVTGTSTIDSGKKVTDSDDTNVTVNNSATISIDKNDNDNGDDKQQLEKGQTATFKIVVKNTGNVALKDVVITDANAPNCAMSATKTKGEYDGDTFDPGESFLYTCTVTANSSFINTAKVTAKTVSGDKSVDASDKSSVGVGSTPPEPEEPEGEDPDCGGSIGNTVWHDKNANGKQDAGEPGIPGVRVWLYKGNKVFKDTTNSQGRYKFKELCGGEFRVTVKHEDIPSLYQTYDPDGKLDHRTTVKLKGDDDDHTKADFGYRGAVAPATGPGTVISVILAALATGFILYFYRRKRMSSAL